MTIDLKSQLRTYGDLLAVDSLSVEEAMTTRIGEGPVRALEPVHRTRRGWRRNLLAVAAAFAVVVVVGFALAIGLTGSEDVAEVPAPPFVDGEDAADAVYAAFRVGDYDSFKALFAPDAPDYFGSEAVTEQRKRERFGFLSLLPRPAPYVDIRCSPNPVVENAWECEGPWPDENLRRVMTASGELTDPLLAKFDIWLSADGYIHRLSTITPNNDTPSLIRASEDHAAWMAEQYPDLERALDILMSTSSHETDPLPTTVGELAEALTAATDEYLARDN